MRFDRIFAQKLKKQFLEVPYGNMDAAYVEVPYRGQAVKTGTPCQIIGATEWIRKSKDLRGLASNTDIGTYGVTE